ncbi:MAG: Modulator of FtsH protease HflC [Alphaproteobacteria bacterium MarineAlpha5_Bin11]|nr:protease modulator HflC [Pelagibacteraceae bacterium]PPR43729.1 MAG: Modulator of FtsH protease HflC [Alphaproteobacteria bacterium MarineAlpha5_Bin11]PPR50509.1 MAG: Modulator of FtsH protease HflC [Alphaproteobacteria bacterium MarineAlpha5_Bin10]|tara:strand:- start:787 stop:1662 length:876 start_codon:yes stop_codon:yes gene_type:complete
MKMSRNFIIISILLILFFTFSGIVFIVNQTQQAIVLQFGEPRQVITEPGLQFKIPFINDVEYFETRVLNLDPQPEEMILSDQKRIIVDSFARYVILDPLKFFQTVRNVTTFEDRFGRILNASVRGVIAKYPLNSLLSEERKSIMQLIKEQVVANENNFGISIIDIRIGRTDLTEEVSNNVFQRMRSEREKEANLLRAEGSEISKEIMASADRQKTIILAEAERTSSILRGEGDAEKNRLLGDAYNTDKDFFDFLRTMQACRDTFGGTEMSMVIAPGEVCEKFFGELDKDNN